MLWSTDKDFALCFIVHFFSCECVLYWCSWQRICSYRALSGNILNVKHKLHKSQSKPQHPQWQLLHWALVLSKCIRGLWSVSKLTLSPWLKGASLSQAHVTARASFFYLSVVFFCRPQTSGNEHYWPPDICSWVRTAPSASEDASAATHVLASIEYEASTGGELSSVLVSEKPPSERFPNAICSFHLAGLLMALKMRSDEGEAFLSSWPCP